VHREAPLDPDDGAGRRDVEAALDLVPRDRFHGAGAVGDDETEEVLAVLARAPVALAHRKRRRDLLSLGELAHEDAHRRAAVGGGQRRLKRLNRRLIAHLDSS
jgi:hypothetical protein